MVFMWYREEEGGLTQLYEKQEAVYKCASKYAHMCVCSCVLYMRTVYVNVYVLVCVYMRV